MPREPEEMADTLLGRDKAEALKKHSGDIQKLAQSTEGKKVRELLGDERQVARALEQGDGEELKKLMTRVLSTQEGSRLARQLMDLLG